MARSLQERTAARGFPVFDVSGQSGQGALPDSTLRGGPITGQPVDTWTPRNQDLGSVPAQLPPPEEYVNLLPMAWGLPAGVRPDNVPKSAAGPWKPEGNTHAAPMLDRGLATSPKDGTRVGEAYIESDATHADEFNRWKIRMHPDLQPEFGFGQQTVQGSPPGPLAPTTGQQRTMGREDGVQGYGGFANGMPTGKDLREFGTGDPSLRGPGGTNGTMPLTVLDRQFPGPAIGYGEAFVSAGEVPFLVPNGDQFLPTQAGAPEFGPWPLGGNFDGPTANVSAQDAVTGDVPATGPAVAAAPAGLLPLWGSY